MQINFGISLGHKTFRCQARLLVSKRSGDLNSYKGTGGRS